MTGKDCLYMIFSEREGTPDFFPANLRQAKQQLKGACLGKTRTEALLGLHFRLEHLKVNDRHKFRAYANKICIDTIKKWNKKK